MTEPRNDLGEREFDLVIIGAGPAGLAAADVIRGYELQTAIIDEQMRAGGQILRQPPGAFTVDGWLSESLYDHAKKALRVVEDRADIDWFLGATVLGVEALSPQPARGRRTGFVVYFQRGGDCETIRAKTVLLATGCYERALAIPGWTLPGVMGAGAIQAFIKSQQFVPGRRFLLAGSHPLQLVVADQLRAAGADVAAVVFSQSSRDKFRLLRYPLTTLLHPAHMIETARILSRLRRARTRILFGHAVTQLHGAAALEHATVSRIAPDGRIDTGRSEIIECDRAGLCHGFLASSEIARQAGADSRFLPDAGGWLVKHDRWFESSVPGLFVAGEITGLAGADASLIKGQIAGFGILKAQRSLTDAEAAKLAGASRRRLRRIDRFSTMLNALSRPPRKLQQAVLTDDTIICRCECVTYGEFREVLDSHPHIESVNAAKLRTRVGMGMCQGRFCEENVMNAVATARGRVLDGVGAFRPQFPVKPLNLQIPD